MTTNEVIIAICIVLFGPALWFLFCDSIKGLKSFRRELDEEWKPDYDLLPVEISLRDAIAYWMTMVDDDFWKALTISLHQRWCWRQTALEKA